MPDYAISAVGRTSGDEHLLTSGSSNEVLRFEEIGSRQNGTWDVADDPWNQFRIIEGPSSPDAQLKSEKAPWDDIATQAMERLDDIQYRWRNSMEPSSTLSAASSTDLTAKDSLSAFQSYLNGILKSYHHILDSQVRVTLVTSIATTAKTSIEILQRQQG